MNVLLEREAPAERLQSVPLRTVSGHDGGKSLPMCYQHGARLEKTVDSLFRTEPTDDADSGSPQPVEQRMEPQALRSVLASGQGKCRVVDDADLGDGVRDELHLLPRNDDNTVRATEHAPVEPVVEARLLVLVRQPMKASHPLPWSAQPAEGVGDGCRFVGM